jgi:hypothetical protein
MVALHTLKTRTEAAAVVEQARSVIQVYLAAMVALERHQAFPAHP